MAGTSSSSSWANKAFVLAAVRQDGAALRKASEELKSDKEVVLAALSTKGSTSYVLCYASEELKDDKEVVLEAVCVCKCALYYASEKS